MSLLTALRPVFIAGTLATLAACVTVAAEGGTGGPMIDDGQEFSLHVGDQVTLADRSTLHYVRLVNDSRCPPGVQCVWAGDAEIAMEWTPASAAMQSFSLHSGKEPKTQTLGERTLTLLSLERGQAPDANFRIEHAP